MIYSNLREFDKAVADCDHALRLQPKFVRALANRGMVYRQAGEMDKSLTSLNESMKLEPQNLRSLRFRALTHFAKGDADAGLKDLKEAIRINPSYRQSYFALQTFYGNHGQYAQAVSYFTELIKKHPQQALPHRIRGWAHAARYEGDDARKDFTEAINLDGRDPVAYNGLLSSCMLTGEFEPLLSACTQAIAKSPDKELPFRFRGEARRLRGEYDLANADFQQAIRLNPRVGTEAYSGLLSACDG